MTRNQRRREQQRQENLRDFGGLIARMRTALLGKPGFPGRFAEDIIGRLESGRSRGLSERQEALCEKLLREAAEDAARDANPEGVFFGELGDKPTITGTVKARYGYESRYGYTHGVTVDDGKGHFFVWRTTSYALEEVKRGDKITLKGTIKRHSTYRGYNQTELTRCKVLSLTAEEDGEGIAA